MDEEWLDTILEARRPGFSTDYDVLVGPIADDDAKRYINEFVVFSSGFLRNEGSIYDREYITRKMALLQKIAPKKGKGYQQYVMVSSSALDRLGYCGGYAFSYRGILIKRLSSDENANEKELEYLAKTMKTPPEKKREIWRGR